jgi:hypothetical protein
MVHPDLLGRSFKEPAEKESQDPGDDRRHHQGNQGGKGVTECRIIEKVTHHNYIGNKIPISGKKA